MEPGTVKLKKCPCCEDGFLVQDTAKLALPTEDVEYPMAWCTSCGEGFLGPVACRILEAARRRGEAIQQEEKV